MRAPPAHAGAPALPDIATPLVHWQARHGRHHLPWQHTRDPYRVWLSEIMLQQTQVSTVLGYYTRFLQRFPDVRALATAHADDVMALWAGLGYYSRARNLHRCAQRVVDEHGGVFPNNAQALAQLPGIGRSTAAAIAAFCHAERVPILDANVRRVLTRVLGFEADLASACNERQLWALAEALLPSHDLAATMPRYTQGLMDLGASLCLPRNPDCAACPLAAACVAQREGAPERYPVKTRRLQRRAQAWWLLLAFNAQGQVWLQRRPPTGIWAGLHCPPVFDSREALQAHLPAGAAAHDLPAFVHVLTHRDLHLHPVTVRWASEVAPSSPGVDMAGGWFDALGWDALGLPAPIRKVLGNGVGME